MHFRFLTFTGSVATLIRWGGWSSYLHMYHITSNPWFTPASVL